MIGKLRVFFPTMPPRPLLPPYGSEHWPTSNRSEDLFRFVVEHISVSNSLSPPRESDCTPWTSSSFSNIERAIVKRPRVDSLEVEGRVLRNDFDVATSFARELRFFWSVPYHPNIVEFYGLIDKVGLVIHSVDGVRLDTRIETRPFALDALKIKWANQLIRAITHIHAFGLSHGDISPGNVLIDSDPDGGNVKLIDFGRSAQAGEGLYPASHPFTAPDNMEASDDPTLSDSYSLGVLLLCLERNEILEDMVTAEELAGMPLPLFGHLIRRYAVEDRNTRFKIDRSDVALQNDSGP
ncbi:kinase-like domain-containing protein [Mycena vitilis]|nr:kinase-like domain-containing protein [Mycena vitilis]